MNIEDWTGLIIIGGVVVLFFAYQMYLRFTSLKVIDGVLKKYYAEQDLRILSISKLSTAEKLKYGVPLNPFISLYTSSFRVFLSSAENYFRLVETQNRQGGEQLRYVEISFTTRNGISVNEFDSYNF